MVVYGKGGRRAQRAAATCSWRSVHWRAVGQPHRDRPVAAGRLDRLVGDLFRLCRQRPISPDPDPVGRNVFLSQNIVRSGQQGPEAGTCACPMRATRQMPRHGPLRQRTLSSRPDQVDLAHCERRSPAAEEAQALPIQHAVCVVGGDASTIAHASLIRVEHAIERSHAGKRPSSKKNSFGCGRHGNAAPRADALGIEQRARQR